MRPAYRAGPSENALDPSQRILDAHHHLYERADITYLLPEFLADLRSGHDVRATVLVQARAGYRTSGPQEMRPVGETEIAREVADCAIAASADTFVAAGIVGFADLLLGDRASVAIPPANIAGRM